MKLIEDIKNYIGRWQLNREIRQKKKNPKMLSLARAQHIGIVYNAESKENEQAINQYANELRAEGKKVFMLGYVDQKQLPHTKKFLLNSEFFWHEKLNSLNLPVKGKIGQFLQLEFDLLLNLYNEPLLPMQAIAAYSKAKYRVGANIEGSLNYYDAVIDTGSRNDLRFLIEQVDFYLRHIK
jgi:hypothetical protein